MIGKRFEFDAKETLFLNYIQKKAKNELNEKIKDGIYIFEDYDCECGARKEDFEVLAEKDRYGLNMKTVICKKCGLIMTNPRMTQESYNMFYNYEYRRLYNAQEGPSDEYFNRQKYKGEKIYKFIRKNTNKIIENVLEIGCSAGGILYYFREKGCIVKGVDLGEEYVKYGQKAGLNLRACSSKELLKDNEKYDLIIVNHVFEHFLDLDSELHVIKQLLNKDGLLYIEVPGVKNLEYSYDCDFLKLLQNAHVYNFTLNTLKQIMEWNGFELICGNEVVRSLFKFNNVKKNKFKLNNYYEENYSYLLQLEENGEADVKEIYKDLSICSKLGNIEEFLEARKIISEYKESEVAIYGTGEHTRLLLEFLRYPKQIRCLFDNDREKIGMKNDGYIIEDINNEIKYIKAIIISSLSYEKIIYDRIKFLENKGIKIIQVYN